MNNPIIRLSLAAFCAVTLSNCAIGQSKVAVTHSPLAPAATQRSGTVIVRTFTDSRSKETDKSLLGNKRNGYGMVLGSYAIKGKSLGATLADHFADALTAAGYKATVSDTASGSAVLSGDIREFWLDLAVAVWNNVEVGLQLKDRGGRVVWTKKVEANKTNVLWLGVPSEIEKVIRESMDKALKQTLDDFASADFAAKVK